MIAFRDHWDRTEPSDETMRAGVAKLIADPLTEFILAAPAGAERAEGVLQLRFRESVWTGTTDAWLEDVYVTDAARGAGLGRALCEKAFERSLERGCRRIQLDVYERNPAARLYRELGFSSESSTMGGETLLMSKSLA
jgi:GNAT superfamily N-acetyltransferase